MTLFAFDKICRLCKWSRWVISCPDPCQLGSFQLCCIQFICLCWCSQ